MKKKKIIGVTFLIICCTLLYFNSNYYINNQNWKYRNGYYVGDILDKSKDVSNNETQYCFGYILIIKNNQTNEKGYYIRK